MTLVQLLSTLTSQNVLASIKDVSNNVIVEIMTGGVSSLEDTLENREVGTWTIDSMAKISVVLKAVE